MKTAMQELIDELNRLERDGLIQIYKSPVGNDMLENILRFLLEKEKEQIRQAYIFGHYDSSLDIYNPSESYSQIINQ
jgi:hypothetical protein